MKLEPRAFVERPSREYSGVAIPRPARTAIVRQGRANAIQIAAVSGHDIATRQKILETRLPRNAGMAEVPILALERDRPGTKV